MIHPDRKLERTLAMPIRLRELRRPIVVRELKEIMHTSTAGIPSVGGQYDHQRTRRESWRSALDQTRLTFQKYGPVAEITPVRLLR